MDHLHQGWKLLQDDPITLSCRAQPTLEPCFLAPPLPLGISPKQGTGDVAFSPS